MFKPGQIVKLSWTGRPGAIRVIIRVNDTSDTDIVSFYVTIGPTLDKNGGGKDTYVETGSNN